MFAISGAAVITTVFIMDADVPQTVLICFLIALIIGIVLIVVGIKKLKKKKMRPAETAYDAVKSTLADSLHGGHEGMVCGRCQKPVLTKEKFVAELREMGMTLAPDGTNISFSGTFRGHDSMENYESVATARLQKLEGMKAIQCVSCGKVYCVDCLSRFAPAHHTSGGKACFSCGGALKEI